MPTEPPTRSVVRRPEAPRSAEHRLDALCVGEAMTLVTPACAERLETAEKFELRIGGAESNVAMYLAGLGHRVGWAGRVGADPLGRRLLAALAAAGVDTSLAVRDPAAPTGMYVKDPGAGGAGTTVYYYRAGSAASLMDTGLLDAVRPPRPRVLHLSGITQSLSPSCRALVDALLDAPRADRAEGEVVSFDVNHRSALWSTEAAAEPLRCAADRADLVFVGLDEAAALWGVSTAERVRALLPHPAAIVVKDAGRGATLLDRAGQTFVPARRVEVVEPVGAGDAFAAGYLSGVLRGLPPERRLRLGHLIAGCALAGTADHVAPPPEDVLAELLELPDEAWNAWPEPAGPSVHRLDTTRR